MKATVVGALFVMVSFSVHLEGRESISEGMKMEMFDRLPVQPCPLELDEVCPCQIQEVTFYGISIKKRIFLCLLEGYFLPPKSLEKPENPKSDVIYLLSNENFCPESFYFDYSEWLSVIVFETKTRPCFTRWVWKHSVSSPPGSEQTAFTTTMDLFEGGDEINLNGGAADPTTAQNPQTYRSRIERLETGSPATETPEFKTTEFTHSKSTPYTRQSTQKGSEPGTDKEKDVVANEKPIIFHEGGGIENAVKKSVTQAWFYILAGGLFAALLRTFFGGILIKKFCCKTASHARIEEQQCTPVEESCPETSRERESLLSPPLSDSPDDRFHESIEMSNLPTTRHDADVHRQGEQQYSSSPWKLFLYRNVYKYRKSNRRQTIRSNLIHDHERC